MQLFMENELLPQKLFKFP